MSSYTSKNAAASSKSAGSAGGTAIVGTTYTTAHQQALELEISVVDAMLKRNRCSHQRAKYFQRLSMAARFVHCKSDITKVWQLSENLVEELTTRRDFERRKRKRLEVFWEIQPRADDQRQMIEDRESYRQRLLAVSSTVFEQIPEALSRLDHAASAFFREISRGFFLPFCTVGVAAIARMRALIVQMAYAMSSSTLPSLQNLYKDAFSATSSSTKKDNGKNNLEVWTNQQLVVFQLFLHDDQRKSSSNLFQATTTTAAQRTERSLADLGLLPPRRQLNATSRQPALSDSAASLEEEGASAEDDDYRDRDREASDANKEAPVKGSLLTRNALDDDDIGESLGIMMTMDHPRQGDDDDEEEDAKDPSTAAGKKRSDEKTGRTAPSSHELDKNMAMVETLRKRKKDKKDRDSSKSNKKKKKRKKEKKKEDFFDELFG